MSINFCDFVHGREIWMRGSDFSGIYHANDLSINEKVLPLHWNRRREFG